MASTDLRFDIRLARLAAPSRSPAAEARPHRTSPESQLLHDTDVMISRLRDLKKLGLRLALDDFGTGYSSLGYLRRFPIDMIKIDKSFVAEMMAGHEQAALARAVVQLGRTLRLTVVAEGIETRNFGQTRAGTNPEPVVVNGVRGTLETVRAGKIHQVRITWQPVAGLWAQATVQGTSHDAALKMARTVRFDRATRCAVPFRLTSFPAGMAVRQCTISLTRQAPRPRLEAAGLWVGDDQRYAWLDVTPTDTPPKWKANTTVGPYRVLHTQQTWLFTDEPTSPSFPLRSAGTGRFRTARCAR